MDRVKLDSAINELLRLHKAELDGKKTGDFREPLLLLGSEGGRFVETVVRMSKPRRGLEIGTSAGFSALCAMRGAPEGFRLTTIDYDPKKAKWAKKNFEKAGVEGRIEIIVDDAMTAVGKLTSKFDYVLLDAAKRQNLPLVKMLLPKLNPGAVVLTDNVITHEQDMLDFLEFVRNNESLQSSLFKVGNGIELTVKLTAKLGEETIPGDKF